MCIIFLITNSNPLEHGYKLILASNRDEHYARPASAAAPWKENSSVLGGRDMEPGREGGTWLAISRINSVIKVGALLNLSGEPKQANAIGRGPIVSDYVTSEYSSFDYTNNLINGNTIFNAFNMVSVEISSAKSTIIHTSNSPEKCTILPDNTAYGFGNSTLSVPLKKVLGGTEKFKKILEKHKPTTTSSADATTTSTIELKNDLMNLLGCEEKFSPDPELMRRTPQWSENLCSIFVRIPEIEYGTRTKTVILVDHNDKIHLYEETMETTDPDGEWTKTYLTY